MPELFTSRIGCVTSPMTVEFREKSIPSPNADEMIIRVRASAVCGSDLHIFKGRHPAVKLPATIGHEFSGDVAALGENVTGFSLGQRVTVEPCITCGICDACRHGDYGYCENISFTYRTGEGSMADYLTVKAAHVFPLPDYLSYRTGALIEPLAVAAHAVRRAAVTMGESVLVIGGGAIGLLVTALCAKTGAREIIVCDYVDEKLALAKRLGATLTVNPKCAGDLCEYIDRLTGGRGVDKSFECVGLEATFRQAMFTLRRNGLATIIGIFEQSEINITASRFVTHEIRVQGAQGYCWDFPVALQMSKEIDLSQLITHTFPLDQLEQALKTGVDPKSNSVKIILEP